MSKTMQPQGPVRDGWLRSNILTVAIAGVLLVGGGVGMAFNRTNAPVEEAVAVAPGDPASDVSTPVSVAGEALPAPTLVRTAAATPVSFEALTPPENPFMRTAADPMAAAPAPAPVPADDPKATPGQAAAAVKSAAAGRPTAAEPAVSIEELSITGVVQGDPPLVVVRYEGQSLFLKIGDQVADTWRLVEIKERSAIFQLGAQRVEVPIKGGSSE